MLEFASKPLNSRVRYWISPPHPIAAKMEKAFAGDLFAEGSRNCFAWGVYSENKSGISSFGKVRHQG